jgi:hypothetical protein
MSPIRSSLLLGAGDAAPTGAQVSRSLRFNAPDSAYLSQSTSRSPAANTSITFSFWVKLSSLTTDQTFFSSSTGGFLQFTYWGATYGNKIYVYNDSSGLDASAAKSDGVLRDPSAWYHFLYSKAHNSNGILYINGVAQATQSTSTANIDFFADASRRIGSTNSGFRYVSSYVANFHCIDGQALTPSSFTETDATTGQLIPKAYTGSYGTYGFYLQFADNSSNTASTLGKDTSGNGNNWTPNNLSVTAGAGNDSLVDSPTSYGTDTGVGGEVRGNYATFNPLASDGTMSNGNLQLATSGSGESSGISSIGLPVSGKWYWEVTMDTIGADPYTGITDGASRINIGNAAVAYRGNGTFSSIPTATNPSTAASYTTGDIIGLAFNADSLSLAFYKNGVIQGTTTGIASRQYFTLCYCYTTAQRTINAGQRAFAYTAPSGFKALCTQNLPAPSVTKSNTVMDVLTWTGTGGSRTLTGLGFSPDLVWGKARSAAGYNHQLYDVIRGTGSTKDLSSSLTAAEGSATTDAASYGYLSSFTSDGFDTTSGSVNNAYWNGSGTTYVAWSWDAGTSTVSNTQGSITSQVRANASAGFSIVTYTGNGSAANIGHGLGVEPHLIIHKFRDTTSNWSVYTKVTGAGGRLILNAADAFSLDGAFPTAPTSSVFYVNAGTNNNGVGMVDYCFAPVSGYSSFGSYVGNGSSDGPMVWTGMRPRWVMIKCSSASGIYWVIMDAVRNSYNVVNGRLFPNTSDPEYTNNDAMDFLSNGFKFRTVDATWNGSGNTYIYAAFAEAPFNYSRAR